MNRHSCALALMVVAIGTPWAARAKVTWEVIWQGMNWGRGSNFDSACAQAGKYYLKQFASDPQICDRYANIEAGAWPEAGGDPQMGVLCNVQIRGRPLPKEGSLTPTYIVQSIQYSIPGAGSTLTYNKGSSRTSTFSASTQYGNDLGLKWDWKLLGFLTGASLKTDYSSEGKITTAVKSTGSETIASASDIADHWSDVFTLWINPTINKHSLCDGKQGSGSEYWIGATFEPWVPIGLDPTLPILVNFSAAELLGKVVPDTEQKRLFLAQLDRSDVLNNMIALNPFFDANGELKPYPVLDKNRFRPIASARFGACGTSFAGISSLRKSDCLAEYSFQQDDTTKFDRTWTLQAELTLLKTGIEDKFTIEYSRSDSMSEEVSMSSAIHLESSSPDVCIDGQIAVDTMFNSIIIPSSTHPCP